MYFDAHSDILTDVCQRHIAGETNVIHNRHLPRLRQGGVGGGLWVLWADPPYDKNPWARHQSIMQSTKDELANATDFVCVRTQHDLMEAKAQDQFYIVLGIEGLQTLEGNPNRLDIYYDFGCRHAMLTWNECNAFASSAMSGSTRGLTALGKNLIKQLEAKNMLVDLSHLNEAGFWDVMRQTQQPLMASHSNAKALCDSPRNLTDEQLLAIRDVGGVVGLNAYPYFISHNPTQQTAAHLAHHAEHIIDLIGIDHLCCGFDFFCYLMPELQYQMGTPGGNMTQNLEDERDIDAFFSLMKAKGLSQEDLNKMAYLNAERILFNT